MTPAALYFEVLIVGERRLVGTHAVPKDEAIEFARQWEPQAYHVDEAAAESALRGGSGGRIVQSSPLAVT